MTDKSKALLSPQELLKKQLAGASDSVQPSGGIRIKIDKTGIESPDGKTGKKISVVIISHELINSYFSKPYDPAKITPADCYAHGSVYNEMAPIETCPAPQADACTVCPMNEWKSAPNGKGKACRNSRLLAIVPADPELIDDHPVWTVSVPPTSIRRFDDYVMELVEEEELTPLFAVTEITQLKNSEWAAPVFKFLGPLPEDMQAKAISRLAEARSILEREPSYDDES
jgi:hypothetical protein